MSTIAEQVHKLIDPKLAQLEASIKEADQESQKVLARLEQLRADQEIALRVLQVIPNGNGRETGEPIDTLVPLPVYGKPGKWLERQKVGKLFTANDLYEWRVTGTRGSATAAISEMKKAGRVEFAMFAKGKRGSTMKVWRKIK